MSGTMGFKSNFINQPSLTIDEFINHQNSVAKEFDFLISEYGFSVLEKETSNFNLQTLYTRKGFDILINFEVGSLPTILLTTQNLNAEKSQDLDSINPKLQRIRKANQERRKSKFDNLFSELLACDNPDYTELNKNYQLYGRADHVLYLKLAAMTLQNYFVDQEEEE